MFGPPHCVEVGRRRCGHEAYGAKQLEGDNVLGENIREPNSGVEAFSDDVRHLVFKKQLNRYLGMFPRKAREQRRDIGRVNLPGQIEPEQARWLLSVSPNVLQGRQNMIEGWPGLAQEHLSRLCEAGAARRSGQKRNPQSLFKLLDCLTHGGWRNAEEPAAAEKFLVSATALSASRPLS